MSENFGDPPMGGEIAATVAKRLEEVRKNQDPETVRISWRGEPKDIHVISMPVAQLYLNPNTHRIRAQRSIDASRDAVLGEKPWGEAGQLYLSDLLKAKPTDPTQTDPDYVELKKELERDGQLAPGVITQNGILVDANTRCVALRDLGEEYIRVGVLPADADWSDINAIELRIQLRKDKRRDYPYINRLISIEEQLAAGVTEKDVAHDWNLAEKSLKADRWAYQLMCEAIDRSVTPEGNRLTLLQFNDQQESLREFYRHYTTLAATDPDAGEQLKETRLASLLLGLPKTSLRYVEGDFYTRFLSSRLPEELRPEVPAPIADPIPGLGSDVIVADGDEPTRAARALTDVLLKAQAQVHAGGNPTRVKESADLIRQADDVFRTAAKLAGQDITLRRKQTAVPDRIVEAADYLTQGSDEFAKSKAERTLDTDAFDSALLELKTSMERLAKQAGRAFPDPGEGVEWLLNAVRRMEGEND